MFLKLITSFLENRFQRVVLNGQISSWKPVLAGIPQGFVSGPLFFLIYINDLSKNLSSNNKLFADDTSIFSTVKNVNLSTDQLNSDVEKISNWAHQWKKSFNPDPKKQAQEVICSRKRVKDCHPSVFFNDTIVERSTSQKHLGIQLDEKLDFNAHIKDKISKAYRGIGLIKKLQSKLPRNALLTIYKSFIRPHLGYGNIVFDQATNDSFCKKTGKRSVQCCTSYNWSY